MKRLIDLLRHCLRPIAPRRYRVTPRQNPFVLRRELRRRLHRMLREARPAGTAHHR